MPPLRAAQETFYCWANCCQHASRLPVPPLSGSLQQLRLTRSGTSNRKAALESWSCDIRVRGAATRSRSIRSGTQPWRSVALATRWHRQHGVSSAPSGEMCGRPAPRGRKVWTQESATLAPDSRRIVAFVSLRHDIRAADRSLESLESIVSKD